MIKKIILTISVSIFIISSPLFARNLSLDDAVGEAVNKSAQVLSNALEIENATIDEENKYSSLYPTLSVSGTAYRANEGTTYDYSAFDLGTVTVDNYLYLSTTLSASFAFNPAMITSLQTTSLSLKNKIISFDKAKKDVELQIKKIYYGILVQEAALDLQKENIDYLQQTLENTQAAYENGDIPEINVLQLKSQISSQRASFEQTQTSIVSQKRTLAFLIGLDDITEELTLTDQLPTTYDDDLSKYTLEKAFAASPDLQSSQINRQMLDVNKKALKESTYFPSLSLSASYNPTWYLDSGSIEYSSEGGSVSATIAFNITNMLPGSSNQKSLQKLEVSYNQLEVGNTSIKDNIVLEFNSNIEAIKEAKRQIELSKESIDLSKQSFELTSLSYESGFSSFSDLQSAQLSVSNAQLSLLQAQYSYVSALLDLEDQCSI
jgi:outer membrane protein TolC